VSPVIFVNKSDSVDIVECLPNIRNIDEVDKNVVSHYPIDRHNLLLLVLYVLQIVHGTGGSPSNYYMNGGGRKVAYLPNAHQDIRALPQHTMSYYVFMMLCVFAFFVLIFASSDCVAFYPFI
jgi:hypothetical protein